MTLDDTDPRAARVQIVMLRDATFERRIEIALKLSATVAEMSRRAIAESMPGASDRDVRLRMAEFAYGRDLVDRVRLALAGRSA